MRIMIVFVLACSLALGGCSATTKGGAPGTEAGEPAAQGKTGTVTEIVDVAGGSTINGLINVAGTEGYLAAVELDDGTKIEAALSGFEKPMSIKTGETKVVAVQQDGKWVVLSTE